MASSPRSSPAIGLRMPGRRRFFELLEYAEDGDTPSKVVDASLIGCIVVSLAATMLESVPELNARFGPWFFWIEVATVAVFTVEYVLRVACAVEMENERFHEAIRGRLRYAASPLALADLLAIAPFYLSAFLAIDLRILRLLRLFRILKLTHYFTSLQVLLDVLKAERQILGAAYFAVVVGIVMAASGVYVFEHNAQPENFSSIPAAIYWAIVTLSSVGYGDVVPITIGGRILGAAVIMLGVGMLAIPTGIVATGFVLETRSRRRSQGDSDPARFDRCPTCGSTQL